MKIKIIPLSKEYVQQMSTLVNSIFPDEDMDPEEEIKASLDQKKLIAFNEKYGEEIISLQYFIALEGNRLLGTVGIYEQEEDSKEADWLGWYSVAPEARGLGIGKKLLTYIVNLSKERGKNYLRLYTSTEANEQVAQIIYEQNGFSIFKRESHKDYDILYREKKL